MVLVLKNTLEGRRLFAWRSSEATNIQLFLALSVSASGSVYLAHLLPGVRLLGGSLGGVPSLGHSAENLESWQPSQTKTALPFITPGWVADLSQGCALCGAEAVS